MERYNTKRFGDITSIGVSDESLAALNMHSILLAITAKLAGNSLDSGALSTSTSPNLISKLDAAIGQTFAEGARLTVDMQSNNFDATTTIKLSKEHLSFYYVFATQTWSNALGYDYVIDSDAKLAALADGSAGNNLHRILVKSGTWTLPVGENIDSDVCGFKSITGEPGSEIIGEVFSHSATEPYKAVIQHSTVTLLEQHTSPDYYMRGLRVTNNANNVTSTENSNLHTGVIYNMSDVFDCILNNNTTDFTANNGIDGIIDTGLQGNAEPGGIGYDIVITCAFECMHLYNCKALIVSKNVYAGTGGRGGQSQSSKPGDCGNGGDLRMQGYLSCQNIHNSESYVNAIENCLAGAGGEWLNPGTQGNSNGGRGGDLSLIGALNCRTTTNFYARVYAGSVLVNGGAGGAGSNTYAPGAGGAGGNQVIAAMQVCSHNSMPIGEVKPNGLSPYGGIGGVGGNGNNKQGATGSNGSRDFFTFDTCSDTIGAKSSDECAGNMFKIFHGRNLSNWLAVASPITGSNSVAGSYIGITIGSLDVASYPIETTMPRPTYLPCIF